MVLRRLGFTQPFQLDAVCRRRRRAGNVLLSLDEDALAPGRLQGRNCLLAQAPDWARHDVNERDSNGTMVWFPLSFHPTPRTSELPRPCVSTLPRAGAYRITASGR